MAIPNGDSDWVFEASGLKKEYDDGQVQALRGVDLRIEQGEFIAIVGPSGSGKSTLLQMLGALDHPSAGTLTYRGASLAERADLASYRAREIGFIFQAFHLLPTFTALENVQIPMFETHRSVSERKHRAIELLKAVGLETRLHHFPAKLSGGERQRVAIARSLANGASVLLADEPTGNLDSENSTVILDLIVGLRRGQNLTLILVTHNRDIVRQAARTIEIRRLELVAIRESAIDLVCECAKGTYIRVLGEDIARALGTVGHLTRLHRAWVEPFRDLPMCSLETALEGAGQGHNLLPADAPLQGLARASLTAEQLAAVRHGQAVQAEAHPRPPQGRRVRIYAPDGLFVGLAEARPDGWLQPRRLIHASAM